MPNQMNVYKFADNSNWTYASTCISITCINNWPQLSSLQILMIILFYKIQLN